MALGAGAGTRMRPLTIERPKVLCPVAGRPLIDHALDRLRAVTASVAVNTHESQPALAAHLDGVAEVSVETGEALGTAGGVANLRRWIDGRDVVIVNGDTWCPGGLEALIDGWDRSSIRILVAGQPGFGPRMRIAGSVLPWRDVERLAVEPTGLYEVVWREAEEAGRVETIGHDGPFVDCATPGDYLRANLAAAGGSVVGEEAEVHGRIHDSVVWDGAVVHRDERLTRAIRTTRGRTVLVRGTG